MSEEQFIKNQQLIKHAYTAFNNRDIDAVFEVMAPDVKWPKAFEGGYVTGHGEVRKYWQRQWTEINPRVTPTGFSERHNGALVVQVHQYVQDMEGNVLFDGIVLHVYTIKNSLLQQMDIELT